MLEISHVRAYDIKGEAVPSGVFRVLVDRLWPRGIKKEDLVLDEWAKDVTPSSQLRSAFHDGALDYPEFAKKYEAELDGCGAVQDLANAASSSSASEIQLVTAVKDVEHSHIPTLEKMLAAHLKS